MNRYHFTLPTPPDALRRSLMREGAFRDEADIDLLFARMVRRGTADPAGRLLEWRRRRAHTYPTGWVGELVRSVGPEMTPRLLPWVEADSPHKTPTRLDVLEEGEK